MGIITETKKAQQERQRLLDEGILQEENGFYIFSEDYVADTATLAVNIILTKWENGFEKWQDKDGRTLKELKRTSV